VVDQQPSLICFDRNRAGTDLGALPCRLIAADRAHHVTVSSPEFHIFTLADKDIAERCMAVVAWTAHHHVVAVDLSREQHAVTVEWKECVLKLNEFLEVIGVSNTDGRAVIAVAPGYIVFVVDFADTRVITVLSCQNLLVSALKFDRFILDLPVDTVFTSSNEDVHADGTAVAAEYTYVSVLERYDCAVEDTVGTFLLVTADDRVLIIAPYRHVLSCWFFLPRHIRQIVSDDFTHDCFPL